MIIQYTWRSVGGWNSEDKYKIKSFQITFNSLTQEMQILELELLNTPIKIIETKALGCFHNYNTHKEKDRKAFEKLCDEYCELIRSRDSIDGFKIDKEDDSAGYDYFIKDCFYSKSEMLSFLM